MKKKLLAIVLCVAMLLCLVACGQAEGDKEEKKTSAKKYMKQIVYDMTGKKVSEIETKFDKSGREVYEKTTSYTAGLEQNETATTEYEFNWVEEGNKATADTGKGLVRTITYDDDKNVIEQVEDGGVSKVVTEYTYKDGKKATQTIKGYMHDEVQYIMEYTFDQYGNILQQNVSYPKSNTSRLVENTYKYDKDGKILSVEASDGTTTQSISMEYIYDANGFLDKIKIGEMVSSDCTYDKDGNLIEAKSYSGEKLTSETFYEYFED